MNSSIANGTSFSMFTVQIRKYVTVLHHMIIMMMNFAPKPRVIWFYCFINLQLGYELPDLLRCAMLCHHFSCQANRFWLASVSRKIAFYFLNLKNALASTVIRADGNLLIYAVSESANYVVAAQCHQEPQLMFYINHQNWGKMTSWWLWLLYCCWCQKSLFKCFKKDFHTQGFSWDFHTHSL